MDKKEFSMFTMALKTYYPKENLLPNTQAMELWFKQLQDIPYQLAEVALNKWVAINKWSPSIADIREMAMDVGSGESPDWGEGWAKVQSAIGRYGMYRSEEAKNTFDDITRQVVDRLGWQNLCLSENSNQDRANFRMIYEQLLERKKVDAQIPNQLKQAIKSIQVQNNNMLLESNS